MSSLKDATKPVDTSTLTLVIVPQRSVPPPSLSADPEFSPISLAPTPAVMGNDTDRSRQFYRQSVSQVRMPPIPAASLLAQGAQIATHVIPVQKTATAAQQTATTAQAGVDALQAVSFQGAYDPTVLYSQGASIDDGGTIYVSLVDSNLGNTPSSSPADWQAIGGSAAYLGAWSSATAYTVGQIVSVGSALYIALANSTNQNPTTTTGFWQLLSGASVYEGAWSSTVAYSVGQTVSYTDGNFYIAISPNTNVVPTPTGSSDWVLLGTSNTLIGAWSSTVNYVAGNEVSNSGNIFQALQANSNQTPPTPPATNAFWQLMGPQTLSNVPDGGGIYGGTSGGTSYRPLSNPLTSTDAGSSATIAIAAFSMRVRNRTATTDISYNSGSITSLSYATLYYIYFLDANFAGGTVTYLASTTKESALSNSGYLFLGSIQTASAGGSATSGNNDGGTGAQYGGVLINWPTANTPSSGTWANPTFAYDADPTTPTITSSNPAVIVYSGFSSAIPPGAKTVVLILDVEVVAGGGGGIAYSINGGASFTTVIAGIPIGPRSILTNSLPTMMNPGAVQIKLTNSNSTTNNFSLWGIYLLFTF
jgi:hypothetical protein